MLFCLAQVQDGGKNCRFNFNCGGPELQATAESFFVQGGRVFCGGGRGGGCEELSDWIEGGFVKPNSGQCTPIGGPLPGQEVAGLGAWSRLDAVSVTPRVAFIHHSYQALQHICMHPSNKPGEGGHQTVGSTLPITNVSVCWGYNRRTDIGHTPPPLIIATEKSQINTVPTPTVAETSP